ncbi:MAG: hypothetical protein UY92_C0005G0009 [Candidatus Magasanikbacteria bacterium GW2011_GWA2_56_11]|uniref:Uncharacterized protein n=1 Tax=Candidatus Magasanikbacteria bacterium GW2011_GWA2_56_11 TaxID=1619044 RepID=A0A0G2AMP2_9BACT|nr:MAG: hypothetical protein UY92_C0005G0009 [Candidatus Magasanikbacteria bacterium GW2011_GWA2_56_11]
MRKVVSYFLPIAILFLGCFGSVPGAEAAVKDWQRGASIMSRWNTDYSSESFKESMRNLKKTNANYVTLTIPWFQSNTHSTDIHRGWETPPADRTGWFAAYGNMIKHYAQMGQELGVEQITVGSELINMSAHDAHFQNTDNWNKLIGQVRGIYSGKLTYSANWGAPGWTDEKNRISFWSSLDSIGISAYFPLPTGDTSVESYKREWQKIDVNDIRPLSNRFGRPVIFTEIGYRSMDWAQWQPFNFWDGGNPDDGNQARLYEALFAYWNDQPYMQGVQLWDWSSDPNAGWPGSTTFTPQHKAAEAVMTKWFASTSPASGVPAPSGSFAINASSNPAEPAVGQSTGVTVSVRKDGSAQNGVVVDMEIYDAAGNKVHQDFRSGQSFAGGETKSYVIQWTPAAAGAYTVKAGVFNSDWSANYAWADNAAQITARSAATSAPGAGSISVWWPADGAPVSGLQPFKALIDGAPLSGYSLHWQVDGGALNGMYDSLDGGPHKESWIDVSGWTWRGAGPYAVKFIAKNSSGATIAERTVTVLVSG